MADRDVRDSILDAIEEVKGVRPEGVADTSQLVDLGLDSLDLLEIGMIVEQRLGLVVPTERFAGLQSLGEVVDVFEAEGLI